MVRRHKRPEANLKLYYRKTLEISLCVSLFSIMVLFRVIPEFDLSPKQTRDKAITILASDIPVTEQVKRQPAPKRPSIPIPTESEEIPEDLTIESTELNLEELPLAPPPPETEQGYEHYEFIAYDEAPVPIGGFAAIQANLVYPLVAKKTGIEAKVIIGVLIDETGKPVKTEILKSSNDVLGFNEAAQRAVMAVRWKPAKQRDQSVKVWVSIPISFKLHKSDKLNT